MFLRLLHKQLDVRRASRKLNSSQTFCAEMIGPANSTTNLRPIRFQMNHNETKTEVKLRILRQETQNFNQDFWSVHNTAFKDSRQKFIQHILKEKYPLEKDKKTLTSEEMSVFYKSFMNDQWDNHLAYNLEWQKRNFKIIFLTGVVMLQKLWKKMF